MSDGEDLIQQPDWSHVGETILLLSLAVAQLEVSILDSEHSVDNLSKSFTKIMDSVNAAESTATTDQFKSELDNMKNNVHNVVTEFQFYDRLAQRLHHIKNSLDSLGELFRASDHLHKPEAWLNLQQSIKDSYTMACEREMFELILNGSSIQEALEHYRKHHLEESNQQQQVAGDIDLF